MKRTAIALFALLTGIYGLNAGGHTYSSDEEIHLATTKSIVSDGDPFFTIDPLNTDVTSGIKRSDGSSVGVTGLGFSVVSIPLYLTGLAAGRASDDPEFVTRLFTAWTNSFITALGVVLFFLLAMRLGTSRRNASLLALSYGLATWAFVHAKTSFSEPLTTTLVLGSAYFGVKAFGEGGRNAHLSLCGALAGCALFARSSAAVFAPVLALWVLLKGAGQDRDLRRAVAKLTWFAIPGLGALSLFLLSNWWKYGSPLNLGTNTGLSLPESIKFNVFEGLAGLLFSPGKSIFLYAPQIVVAIMALRKSMKERRGESALFVGLGLANMIFFARISFWHGDQAWGPRYMVMSLPFFLLPLATALEERSYRRLLAGASALGFASAFLGTMLYHNQYFQIVADTVGKDAMLDTVHYDPKYSPLAGHARALPETLVNVSAQSPLYPDSGGATERFQWFFKPPRPDFWWYWVGATSQSSRLRYLGIPFVILIVVGAAGLRKTLLTPRDSAAKSGSA